MSEVEYTIHGELSRGYVLIDDENTISELTKKGFGDSEGKKYLLRIYEALYLLFSNKMVIKHKNQLVNFDQLVDIAMKKDDQAWTRFLVYRDLRSKGYVAKEGFGFGVDFRVYDRGDFGNKSAKYVVFGINEGTKMEVKKLNDTVGQIRHMGKEPVIAVIERRGEVIYYKVSTMRFLNNKSLFDIDTITK